MSKRVELGKVYRDTISGFVGTATGRAEYLHKTPSVQIVADTGPQGDDSSRWIDEGQLVPISDEGRVGFGSNPP